MGLKRTSGSSRRLPAPCKRSFVVLKYGAMKPDQVQAVVYLAVGALAAIATLVYSLCQRRKKESPDEDRSHRRIDPHLCLYIKKNGEQCQHEPKRGSRYCALHARKELMRRIESAPRQRVYEIDPNDV